MKNQIKTFIAVFLLVLATAGTALVIGEVLMAEKELATQPTIQMDESLTVLP